MPLHSTDSLESSDSSMQSKIYTKILVVGAGFGGLGMGVALKQAGENDFIILEKGSDVGGVWRDNKYPGCTCDVPSHLYSFSFAPYQNRKQRFPPQQDILAYLQDVAHGFGLMPHLQFDTEVVTANFQQDHAHWDVVTACGQFIRAEVVIFAVGQLHRPNYPDIPGLREFRGRVVHTAEWNENIDIKDKKVCLIGTGSSAAQMLPSLASASSQTTVFQRTAQWILPKPNSEFGRVGSSLLKIPGAHHCYRRALSHGADIVLSPVTRSHTWRRVVEQYARHNLRSQVTDEHLAQKLMPTYPIGSKRILFDNHFYSTLSAGKAQLVADPIKSIKEEGIQTKNGETIAADVIICATGFRASEFLVPMEVEGRDGHHLNADWSSGAKAYLGLAVHGYPNLFLIAGPNSFNPAGSNPEMKEHQISYIMRCLRWKAKTGAAAIEVSEEATAGYDAWLETKMKKTIWPDSVDSWYKNKNGSVTNPWPESLQSFTKWTRGRPEHSFSGTPLHLTR